MTTATALGELTGDFVLDTARTRIGFTARAMLVGKVRGGFEVFEGSARLDGGNPSKSAVRLTIGAASIQTRNPKRDRHLRGGDFLDAEAHPALTFVSTAVKHTGGTAFEVTGDLTVRGVTRQVTVSFELTDSGHDPQGGHRAVFTGRTVIDREDWGVSGARGMVGRKVALDFDVMAVRRS
ncbi:YceI family protein [Streptomyces iakyrus]|uniref:YceI family protein n=1 Tax=Streptomyces iakyrus TaxID=68219 RepID=UPI003D9235F7